MVIVLIHLISNQPNALNFILALYYMCTSDFELTHVITP